MSARDRTRVRRRHDIEIDGYRIRNEADFDRVDLNKAQRKWKHRKAKLDKRRETRLMI